MEPFGDILRPSRGSDRRFDVFDTVAVGSSGSAVGGLKLGQIVLVTKAGSLNARLAKWSILLSQFDIRYVPQKTIKGQALVDFLAEHPLPKDSPLRDDLPNEPVYNVETSSPNASWNMYFDGATRTNEKGKPISGIGILFVSPDKYMIPQAFSLLEPCSNNVTKYQALIIGLELALKSITMLEAFGDSQLIVNQMDQKYEIRKPDLLPYYNKAQSLQQKFNICHISQIRRGKNIRADALARLAASMAIQEGENMQITVCQRRIFPPLNTHQAVAKCH
ncbi:hypothetical protein MRB53_020971 [Persea americana]|uniref:Uncharacterized protein n=1 Tax=Persea americana TaxID=3435 RepID=A0ACC2L2J2_PERAE|nr:hypothetical protein MRB53_020971 [Persea americana]